jgi:prevent-host-death family protein
MTELASRELRNATRSVLDRVAAGEHLTITVDGRPVAELSPVNDRSHWTSRRIFIEQVLRHQADPDLTADLAALSDETTDDLPLS